MLIPNFKTILLHYFLTLSIIALSPLFASAQGITLNSHGLQSFGGAFQGAQIQAVPFGANFIMDTKYSMVAYYIGYDVLNYDTQEKAPESISIYPNPVVEYATLNVDVEKVEVLDLNGKVLTEYQRVMKGERINLRRFTDGMYIARLTLLGEGELIKIVKLNKSST